MNRILSWLLRLAALSAVVAVAWVVYLDTKPRQAPVQVAEPQTGLSGEAKTSTAAESVQPQQLIVKDEEPAPGGAAEEAVVTPPAASAGAGPETAAAETAAAEAAAPEAAAAEAAAAEAAAAETAAPEAAAPETAAAEAAAAEAAAAEAAAAEAAAAETAAAETAAPEAAAPEAAAAETAAAETAAAETAAAETAAAETAAAETAAPEAAAPETAAPETAAPETAAPETAAPETAQPPEGAPGAVVRNVERAPATVAGADGQSVGGMKEPPAAPAETVVASVTESVAEPFGMESGQPAGEAGQSASSQEPQQDFMARWQSARMAAWQGRLEEAEAMFQSLHEERPDDYDLSGELGNVQFALGHLADAAQSYFMTSLRLAADGYDVDAVRLMWTVKRLDPELGTRLEHDLLGETAAEGESGESAAGSD